MPRPQCPSLEAVLRPDEIGQLLGEQVTEVHVSDFSVTNAYATSAFVNVALHGELNPRLFVKRIDGARDWMARATHDDRCRSVTLWQHGLLDRFGPEISRPVLACAKDEQGHASDLDGQRSR